MLLYGCQAAPCLSAQRCAPCAARGCPGSAHKAAHPLRPICLAWLGRHPSLHPNVPVQKEDEQRGAGQAHKVGDLQAGG